MPFLKWPIAVVAVAISGLVVGIVAIEQLGPPEIQTSTLKMTGIRDDGSIGYVTCANDSCQDRTLDVSGICKDVKGASLEGETKETTELVARICAKTWAEMRQLEQAHALRRKQQ